MNPIEEKHYHIPSTKFGDIEAHATITKETAVGFAEFIFKNCCTIGQSPDGNVIRLYKGKKGWINDSELYDLYVESLKK